MSIDLTNTVPILSRVDHVGDPEAEKRAWAFGQKLANDMDDRIVAEIAADNVDPFATMFITLQLAISFAARTAAALVGAYDAADGSVSVEGDDVDMSPEGVEAFVKEQFVRHFADAMSKQRASARGTTQ